jgi:hypothetical protein
LLIYYLLALIPFALVGYVLWAYQRKAAEKQALSQQRMTLLMGETERERGQHEASPAAAAETAQAAPTTQPKIVTGKAPPWARRERFLSKSEAVVYYLLKTALRRDHEIYVHVALSAVVAVGDDVPAYEREQSQRRLAQHELTFVVCDKALHVIAALELNEYLTEMDADFKAECLKSAGIRLVHLDATALPPRDAIRTLVYDI